MKLNLGCGTDKLGGWVNVDISPAFAPDVVHDLESVPWPFEDDSAEAIRMIHVLEHLGGDTRVFLAIVKELYRVGRDGTIVEIHVPHPRHDDFINDPTHVRAITLESLFLFDRKFNDHCDEQGAANTRLGRAIGVDFAIDRATLKFEEPYRERVKNGELTFEQAVADSRRYLNVVKEIQIRWRVRKPAAGADG